MKARIIAAVAAIALVGAVASAIAQETAPPPPDKVRELYQQFLQERAETLSQILDMRAEIARLSAREEPDQNEIQKLVAEITELRTALWKKCAEYGASVAPARWPLAPRAGVGSRGFGRGFGYGPYGAPGPWQRHIVPGYGWGGARGGRGPGFGRGPGLGYGPGLGAGKGMGRWGGGPFFVDRDSDGVCDYWQGSWNPPRPPVGPPPAEAE